MSSAHRPPEEVASGRILGADCQVVCGEEALPEGNDVGVCQQAVVDNLALHVLVQAAHLALQAWRRGVTLCLVPGTHLASVAAAMVCEGYCCVSFAGAGAVHELTSRCGLLRCLLLVLSSCFCVAASQLYLPCSLLDSATLASGVSDWLPASAGAGTCGTRAHTKNLHTKLRLGRCVHHRCTTDRA